jgi:GT2 family glycosyltransferase
VTPSRRRAAKPPVLAVFDTPPVAGFPAAFLKALRGAAEVKLLVAGRAVTRDPEALSAAAVRAARASGARALVVCDGPLSRPALPGLRSAGLPTMLAVDGASAPSAAGLDRARRPGPGLHGLPSPAQIWQFGRCALENAPSELLPGSFHAAPKPEASWIAARLAEARAPRMGGHELATIIVPCWNQLAVTKQCLSHLQKWTSDPYEVLVIDNGSTDGTAAYVRSLKDPRFRVLRNERNLGFARAINRGLEAARGKYAVWLNNDCFVTPSWLDRLAAAIERAPWIGMVGPYTNETSGIQMISQGCEVEHLPHYAEAFALRNAGQMRWAHRLTGFCLMQRTELARRIGGLDERFGLGCYEDLDYCLRVRQAGYEMFVAEDVFVLHKGHATFDGGSVSFRGQVLLNREVFIDKWCRKSLEYLDELDARLSRGIIWAPEKAPSRRRRPR